MVQRAFPKVDGGTSGKNLVNGTLSFNCKMSNLMEGCRRQFAMLERQGVMVQFGVGETHQYAETLEALLLNISREPRHVNPSSKSRQQN